MPELDKNNLTVADYPGIASDVPDLDIIRVGQNYYMVSTTMNLVPGVPIMKSTDLVHWEIILRTDSRHIRMVPGQHH